MMVTGLRLGVVIGLGWLASGCAMTEAPVDPATGSLVVNLAASAPSGAVYRLRDATITVTGDVQPLVFHTEDDPDRTALSASVAVGDYAVFIASGWRLERVQGGTATTVEAALVSANPTVFQVAEHARTAVALRFRTATEDVDLAQGYDLSLGVEEVSPHGIVISNRFWSSDVLPVAVFSIGARDNVAPQRALIGAATAITQPNSVVVAGDQLFVVNNESIGVFPRLASGNVAPARRIAGPSTEISNLSDLAVSGGELFVSQYDGPLLVFPVGATGDVAPVRTLEGPLASGLAIDQGEIYACERMLGKISVYPTTASGAATATRVISGPATGLFAPHAIAIHGGELFVSQFNSSEIRVFAETASGDVPPLRVIGGLGFPQHLSIVGDELFVADASIVRVFPLDASGNTAPSRVITGSKTKLGGVTGIAAF